MVNEIRCYVKDWQEQNYPGVNSSGRRMLLNWRDSAENQDLTDEDRPFFCQREAVETLVWLISLGSKIPQARVIWEHLQSINSEWNDEMMRVAVKMATGAGKTRTMAMLIAYLRTIHPGGCQIVVLSPNLTVFERLKELQSLSKGVAGFRLRGKQPKITSLNFQKFGRKNESWDSLGGAPSTVQKALLRTQDILESPAQMLNRLLGVDPYNVPLYVFQDEGHHCRRKEDNAGDDIDSEGQWYGAIRSIADHRNLKIIVDFSATPCYLSPQKKLTSLLFPWTVSDYPVEDAIEAGICKIPRVPVNTDTDSEDIRFQNLYEFCQNKNVAKNWSTPPPQ